MFGLSVTTPDGFVQIDQDYSNYALIASGSASISSASPYYTVLNFGSVPQMPLIFVRSATSALAIVGYGDTTVPYNYSVPNYSVNYFDIGAVYTNATFEYRIYGQSAPTNPSSGMGMKVMDANGTCVFSSEQTGIMRIGQVLNFNTASESTQSMATNIYNPWVCINNSLVQTMYGGGLYPHLYGIQGSGAAVYLSPFNMYTNAVGPYPRYSFTLPILVLAG